MTCQRKARPHICIVFAVINSSGKGNVVIYVRAGEDYFTQGLYGRCHKVRRGETDN